MKRYDLILADADDTLLDFGATERSAVERLFDGWDADIPRDTVVAEYHRINKAIWKEVEEGRMDTRRLRAERFRRLFDTLGLSHDPVEWGERFITYLSEGSSVLDGAEEFCRSWSNRCPIVIVTNGIADVQRPRLERSVIRPYISGIIISEEVGAGKPDRRMFDAALRAAPHNGLSSVLMIGDSLSSDIFGGMQYGIDTCWINPSGVPNTLPMEPTYIVRSIKELPLL